MLNDGPNVSAENAWHLYRYERRLEDTNSGQEKAQTLDCFIICGGSGLFSLLVEEEADEC